MLLCLRLSWRSALSPLVIAFASPHNTSLAFPHSIPSRLESPTPLGIMVLYMMVRLPNERLLKTLIDTMVLHDLTFSVAKNPGELLTMAQKMEPSVSSEKPPTVENILEELITCKEEEEQDIEKQNFENQASETPKPPSRGGELNALDLLLPSGSSEDPEDPEDSPDEPSLRDVLMSKRRSRSPNNIKRYRKKECQLCHKMFMVPFWRTKIQHATVHFQFKRFVCAQCPWRTMHACTIRQHVLKLHPMVPDAGNTGAGYYDAMTPEQTQALEELTARCFPDPLP